MNQLVTDAAKFHFMDNGQTTVPMVVWAAIGRGWGSGAQHSQAIHGHSFGGARGQQLRCRARHRRQGTDARGDRGLQPRTDLRTPPARAMKKDGVVPEGIYKVPIGKGTTAGASAI